MEEVTVPIVLIDSHGAVPQYATEGSSGFDLVASRMSEIPSGAWALISTEIAVAVPKGYELQIRSRSGMASKGLIVLNQPGTLDSDYRGEVGVLLLNLSPTLQLISAGMRIAQGVICPVVKAKFELVEKLDETVRGTNGYGSTGR